MSGDEYLAGLADPDAADELMACADLAGRCGARNFQIGYLHEGVPVAEAGWYAHVQMRGARITAEDHPGPVEAARALARRILTGAKCRCGCVVNLDDDATFVFEAAPLADGSLWTAGEATAAGACRWRREGARWEPGCPEPHGRRRTPTGGRR